MSGPQERDVRVLARLARGRREWRAPDLCAAAHVRRLLFCCGGGVVRRHAVYELVFGDLGDVLVDDWSSIFPVLLR